MATNFEQDGRQMWVHVGTAYKAGYPCVVGNHTPGVCLTDATADGHATVQFEGVFTIPVLATAAAVGVGDIVNFSAKGAPLTNVGTANKIFGIALAKVATDATTSIKVRLTPKVALPKQVEATQLAANAVTTTKIMNSNVTSAKVEESLIKTAAFNLTATQLGALKTENGGKGHIIVASAANKVVEFVSALVEFKGPGTGATKGGKLQFKVGVKGVSATIASTFVQGTNAPGSKVAFVQALSATTSATAADRVNKRLYFTIGTALKVEGLTGGTKRLVGRVTYRIHDLA